MNWISVEDRLPAPDDIVDIFIPRTGERWTDYKYLRNVCGKYGNDFFDPIDDGLCVVRDATHWMLRPEPPTGELYE